MCSKDKMLYFRGVQSAKSIDKDQLRILIKTIFTVYKFRGEVYKTILHTKVNYSLILRDGRLVAHTIDNSIIIYDLKGNEEICMYGHSSGISRTADYTNHVRYGQDGHR